MALKLSALRTDRVLLPRKISGEVTVDVNFLQQIAQLLLKTISERRPQWRRRCRRCSRDLLCQVCSDLPSHNDGVNSRVHAASCPLRNGRSSPDNIAPRAWIYQLACIYCWTLEEHGASPPCPVPLNLIVFWKRRSLQCYITLSLLWGTGYKLKAGRSRVWIPVSSLIFFFFFNLSNPPYRTMDLGIDSISNRNLPGAVKLGRQVVKVLG
jgi:hypothetical protein